MNPPRGVLGVVEGGGLGLESLDERLGDLFGLVHRGDDDEVVAAHVADEGRRARHLGGDLADQLGRGLEHLVAPREPVVVVVRLEVVQVDVEQRELVLSASRRCSSSWMRMLPGSRVKGDWARSSLARRSTPRTRASSSAVSNGLTM